jgi:hypothetical protein
MTNEAVATDEATAAVRTVIAVVRITTAVTAETIPAEVDGAGNRVVVRSVVDVNPGRAITGNELTPPQRHLRLRGLAVNRQQTRCTVIAVAKL